MNMDRSKVMAALEAVNAVLKAKNQKATVVITGGAAIMFQFPDFPREVKDLDAGYMSPELQAAVEQVTWEMDLSDDWFNDTSKDYYAPKKGQTVPGPQFSNLSIELPSKEYLLCLKIMSGRPEEKANDPVDVGFLVTHMPNIKSEKDWQDLYVKFFGKKDWKPYTAEAARLAIEAKGGSKTSDLKTEKGTPIRRSYLGVGKDIGGAIYLHRNYKGSLPNQEALAKAEEIALVSLPNYNVIKWNKDGTYTFFESPDFDTADEPVAGNYVVVKSNGDHKNGSTAAIWHHKWLWVKDDYTGFDVNAAKEHSKKWLAIPGIDFNRIGNKEYWETNVVPKIGKIAKAPYKLQDFEGFQILIGRSAIENDILSLEVANSNDFWFHVAGAPGSHIVVRNPDNLKELPGPVMQQVKQLAIHNSKARGTDAEVHWGFAKDVSKPEGSADGEVNIANWKKAALDMPPEPPAMVQQSLPTWVKSPTTPTSLGFVAQEAANSLGDVGFQRKALANSGPIEFANNLVDGFKKKGISGFDHNQVVNWLVKHISITEYYTNKTDGIMYAHLELEKKYYDGLVKILEKK